MPVTAAAGRSGVCGASVPVFGGVLLDLTAIEGIVDVDTTSMLVDVLPGTFGDVFEEKLRAEHGVTCGHWPQSMALSTVGGWIACRGAGQFSTRYGKIEDIVESLDVVLADGTYVTTGGAPARRSVPISRSSSSAPRERSASSSARACERTGCPRPRSAAPTHSRSFEAGLDAMRRIVQRGATPAVLRLYDATEADRNYQTGDANVLLALDEGDAHIVEATRRIIDEECARADAAALDVELVGRWMEHRNDVSALEALISRGFVVDTMEISASWSALPEVYARATEAILAVEHTMVASAHQSHSYLDGACLYFTFAGKPPEEEREQYYRAAWDAGQRAVLQAGGALVASSRRRLEPLALRRRRARRGVRRPAVGEGRARSERHPESGQARLAEPVRRRRMALTERVLVVDVGTSSIRAVVFDAAGNVVDERAQELLPDTPADGLVEFDASRMANVCRRARDGRPRRNRRGRRGRHLEPARIDRRLGSRDRASPSDPGIGWQDLRTVGACLALRAEGISLGPNQSATKLQWLLEQLPDRARAETLCFGTVDTWVAWTLSRGAVHAVDASNAAVTGLQVPDRARRRGTRRRSTRSASRPRCCRRSSTRARSSATPPRSRARHRSRRCSAISRRRSSARAACGEATPRSPSARAACSTSCSATNRPRSIGAGRPGRSRSSRGDATATSRGASKRSCSRRGPTCSGSATTSA